MPEKSKTPTIDFVLQQSPALEFAQQQEEQQVAQAQELEQKVQSFAQPDIPWNRTGYVEPKRPEPYLRAYAANQPLGAASPVWPHWDESINDIRTSKDKFVEQSLLESLEEVGLGVAKLPWKLIKGFVRSVNFLENNITFRERVARMATVGLFFVPLGAVPEGALLGLNALQRAITIGLGEAALGGGIAGIRGDPVLPAAVFSGVLGGVLSKVIPAFGLRGKGNAGVQGMTHKIEEWFDFNRFTSPKSPLIDGKKWAILSAQVDGVDHTVNRQLNETLRRELAEEGYQVIHIKGSRPERARRAARAQMHADIVAGRLPKTKNPDLLFDIIEGKNSSTLRAEDAYIVLGMDDATARQFAVKYRQSAFISSDGLTDIATNTHHALLPDKIRFNRQIDRFQDYYSMYSAPDALGRPQHFGFSLAFDKAGVPIERITSEVGNDALAAAGRFVHSTSVRATRRSYNIPRFLEKWYTKIIDPMGGMERYERDVIKRSREFLEKNKGTLTAGEQRALTQPEKALYQASTWAAASKSGPMAFTEQMLYQGVPRGVLKGQIMAEPLAKVLEPVGTGNIPHFERYLAGRRIMALARDALVRRGKRTLESIPDHEIDAELVKAGFKLPINADGQTLSYLDWRDGVVGLLDREHPEFAKAAEGVYEWRNAALRALLGDREYPLLPSKDIENILRESHEYVPFRRIMDLVTKQAKFGIDGSVKLALHDLDSPLKRMVEFDSPGIESPLENIIKEAYVWSSMYWRNRAAANLVELAQRGGGLIDEATPAMPMSILRAIEKPAAFGDIVDRIQKSGFFMHTPEKAKLAQTAPVNTIAEAVLAPHIIQDAKYMSVFDAAKQKVRWFEVLDPQIAEAFKFMAPQHINKFIEWAGMPSRLLRAGATWTVDFMSRNVIRDVAFSSTVGLAHPMSFFTGLGVMFGKSERMKGLYRKWLNGGGPRSTMVSMDEMPAKLADVMHGVRDRPTVSRIVNPELLKNPLKLFQVLSEYSENVTRSGVFAKSYKAALAKGFTEEEALFEGVMRSKRASVDFSVHGNVLEGMRLTTAFWNPMLQGYNQMYKALRDTPGAFARRALLGITLPSVLLYIHNRRDPEYKALPGWERNLFWHFKTGKGTWIRIPKPFEPGLIFGTAVEKMLESIDNEDPKAFDEWGMSMIKGQGQQLIPIPTLLSPFLDIAMNKDRFRNRPLVPEGIKDIDPRFQQTLGTSLWGKWLGKISGFSPIKIDHIFTAWTGGLGREVSELTSPIPHAMLNSQEPTFPNYHDPRNIPGLRSWVSRFPAGAQPVSDFYDEAGRSARVKATYNFLKKTYRFDDLADYMQTNYPAMVKNPIFQKYMRQLTDIRQLRDRIILMPGLNAANREQLLRDLNYQGYYLISTLMEAMN